MRSVFITGGPRNGPTLLANLITGLGLISAAQEPNYANNEDLYLSDIIDHIN